jgi:hypothetical protein
MDIFDKESGQTRDYCVATQRAARPDRPLRKERWFSMTKEECWKEETC